MNDQVEIREKAEREWVIARDGGLWLVGQLADDDGGTLSPVYEVTCQVTPNVDSMGRQVGANIGHNAQPLLLIDTLDSWEFSDAANVWPLKGSSVEKTMRQAIANAAGIVAQMRASRVGLTLATKMPERKGRQ